MIRLNVSGGNETDLIVVARGEPVAVRFVEHLENRLS